MSYFARSDEMPLWMGELPPGWGRNWLKWSVDLCRDRPPEGEGDELPYISNEDIESWTGRLLVDAPRPSVADAWAFQVDDVLFNKLRPYLAKVYHAEFAGVSSGELLCLRPSPDVEPRFLFYVVLSRGFVDVVNSEAFGAKMPRADWEIVGHQPLPLPDLETQRRIVRFLDDKTAWIDELVGRKKELLERLAEKRQALITTAVTKGLEIEGSTRPSGIDWLGDIPSHWQVLRLKFLSSRPLSYGQNAAAEYQEREWPRFVRITDVGSGGRLREETFRSLPPELAQEFLLAPNDILVARSGATVGKSLIYKASWGVACYAGYLIRARIKAEHDARYFYWFLNSIPYWEWVRATFIQSTIQNISAARYADLEVPHPPDRCEQEEIAEFIERSCAAIDGQSEAIASSLERLGEYRSAMISAAVTGQIAGLA